MSAESYINCMVVDKNNTPYKVELVKDGVLLLIHSRGYKLVSFKEFKSEYTLGGRR